MAPDQSRPGVETADGTEERLPVLVVDPAVLEASAWRLDDLPGPHSPTVPSPTAEAIEGSRLTTAIDAYHRRYRAVAVALAIDNDTTSAHLANAATAYRRVEARVTALLTETAAHLPATPLGATPDNTEPDRRVRDELEV